MDLSEILRDCYRRKEALDRTIAAMEELARSVANRGKRRGRHSMGSQERQQVAERMRTYWANRRKEKS